MLPLLKAIVGKDFAIHRKSANPVISFSRVAFVVYGVLNALMAAIITLKLEW